MTPPADDASSPRSVHFRTEIGSLPHRDRSGGPDSRAGHSVAEAPAECWDALVVGGGIAGLTAAWELTRAGLRPLLVEARGYTGGLVAAGTIAGVRMDLGAEGFAVRGGAVTGMASALGLDVVGPQGGGARLLLPPRPGEPAQSPPASSAGVPARGWRLHRFVRDAVLGIPAHPLADDVVAVIGGAAAERAARDARLGEAGTRPGDPEDLASFVRTRMGDGVLDRLVGPIVAGIHSADPAALAADTVVPGLREATARLGSLQAAVGEALERRRARGRGRADMTIAGGLSRLTDALRAAVESAGGGVLTRTGAQWLRPAGSASGGPDDGPPPAAPDDAPGWDVAIAPTGRGPTPSDEPVPVGPARIVRTPRVVLACSAPAALRLLDGAGGAGSAGSAGSAGAGHVDTDLPIPVGAPIARFILVAHAPDLGGAPVGSGLLVASATGTTGTADATGTTGTADATPCCPVRAKALSHLSVKWPWIGAELAALHGPDTHALRLSYGRPGEPRPEVDLERALADARALTGARISPSDVVDSALVRWDGTLPPATPEHRARVHRLLAQVRDLPGLTLTGAWVAGTGIAAVVEHARRQAIVVTGADTGSLPVASASIHQEE